MMLLPDVNVWPRFAESRDVYTVNHFIPTPRPASRER
jgi:hypothetical protein